MKAWRVAHGRMTRLYLPQKAMTRPAINFRRCLPCLQQPHNNRVHAQIVTLQVSATTLFYPLTMPFLSGNEMAGHHTSPGIFQKQS